VFLSEQLLTKHNTVTGGVETRAASFASFASAACPETYQESSTLLRKKMATMYVRQLQLQVVILTLS